MKSAIYVKNLTNIFTRPMIIYLIIILDLFLDCLAWYIYGFASEADFIWYPKIITLAVKAFIVFFAISFIALKKTRLRIVNMFLFIFIFIGLNILYLIYYPRTIDVIMYGMKSRIMMEYNSEDIRRIALDVKEIASKNYKNQALTCSVDVDNHSTELADSTILKKYPRLPQSNVHLYYNKENDIAGVYWTPMGNYEEIHGFFVCLNTKNINFEKVFNKIIVGSPENRFISIKPDIYFYCGYD